MHNICPQELIILSRVSDGNYDQVIDHKGDTQVDNPTWSVFIMKFGSAAFMQRDTFLEDWFITHSYNLSRSSVAAFAQRWLT